MRGWLLDTNILSELSKPLAAPSVVNFIGAQPLQSLFTTDVTFGELIYGVEQIADAVRRADYHLWIDHHLRPLFSARILPISESVIVRWKAMVVDGQKRGHTFGQPDLFVAAIAALEDLVVVSRDVSQFVAADVPVYDPWHAVLHAQRRATDIVSPATIEMVTRILQRGRRM